jgi:predicted permease
MSTLFQDLKFAARLLWKDKAFAIGAVVTLAVCIGANAAVFCIVNSILLRPLPFPEADRVMLLHNSYPKAGADDVDTAVPDYYDRLRETTVFEEQALYRELGGTIGSGERAERLSGLRVTPSFFRLLRVNQVRGRAFGEDDAVVGQERKLILSYGLWQRAFGADPGVIGRDVRLNAVPYTVVGIMPRGFAFASPDIQFWAPAAFTDAEKSDAARHSNNWTMIGRLRPGASLDLARKQIDALNARNLDRFPQSKQLLIDVGFNTKVHPLQAYLVRRLSRTLYLLWGGAALVLLIGCVNIANLVLARSTVRMKEMAMRHVLGAGFGRLAAQVLTETTLLGLVGGALGILVGGWGLTLIAKLGLERLPRASEVHLDFAVVAYTLAVAFFVGLLIGLVPLLRMRSGHLTQAFRDEGRTSTRGRASRAARRTLVAAQVAIALVLLTGAALLFASFRRVTAIDPGFAANHLLTGTVSLPRARYTTDVQMRAYAARALERIRALPGVEVAGLTDSIPFGDNFNDSVMLPEGFAARRGEPLITVDQETITPGYAEAMRLRLRRGRLLNEGDSENAPRVILIDERLARRFWPGQDPIGKRLYPPSSADDLNPGPNATWYTVVGVVATVKKRALDAAVSDGPFAAAYFSYPQQPERTITLVVRLATGSAAVLPALRAELARIDPDAPLHDVRSMEERIGESLTARRAPMMLGLVFAAVALFLAAVGIYGVLAYQVSERRREIGIRMALGGDRASIFRLVVREGMLLVGIGTAAGLGGAWGLGRALESQLYEIRPLDPAVLGAVVLLLGLVALVACVVPASRASRLDPVRALNDL